MDSFENHSREKVLLEGLSMAGLVSFEDYRIPRRTYVGDCGHEPLGITPLIEAVDVICTLKMDPLSFPRRLRTLGAGSPGVPSSGQSVASWVTWRRLTTRLMR